MNESSADAAITKGKRTCLRDATHLDVRLSSDQILNFIVTVQILTFATHFHSTSSHKGVCGLSTQDSVPMSALRKMTIRGDACFPAYFHLSYKAEMPPLP